MEMALIQITLYRVFVLPNWRFFFKVKKGSHVLLND
jgi:hypothetical protein